MAKVTVIGKYCFGEDAADGQSIKTRIVTQEIVQAIGEEQVSQIDTHNWRKAPFRLFLRSVRAVRKSDNVIFMTDQGGIKIFPWLLVASNAFGKCKLHYVVVGGWLTSFLGKNPIISFCLRMFDAIYVETQAMKKGLEALRFSKVILMPNCRPLTPLENEDLSFDWEEPFKLCTFSRVMREKGIEDAVQAIRFVNAHHEGVTCTLDIYGQVDPGQVEWFKELRGAFPSEVRYCGIVPFDKTTDCLKNYHALLFPTRFYTEGNPGTIIDAYAAGVPVVASRWENYADMIEEERTGITYPFCDGEILARLLCELVDSPERIQGMRKNCLLKAREYLPHKVMSILLGNLR